MPLDVTTPASATRVRPLEVVYSPGEPGGTFAVRPEFAAAFARLGLVRAGAVLDLPGVVVSGHPDRHVVRTELPGAGTFYLKRQHVVGWREKLKNRCARFGWVSRCEREAALLDELGAAGLPVPRWAACGTLRGRAFLLVEAVPHAADLRHVLRDGSLTASERRTLAANVGAAVARFHAAGVSTPDLTTKHVLVNRATLAVTLIDWQSANRGPVGSAARADALGALHASLAPELASPLDRARVMRSYGHPDVTRAEIERAAARHARRRSVRDQLRPDAEPQQLVWLAGEAVCATPEAAAAWPKPVISAPFYGFGPNGTSQIRFARRDAILVRGSASAPLGRLGAWLRAAPWRSPGVTIGRVLFHLQRYEVPGPRLLAFGQRSTSATRADWFALYEPATGVPVRQWRRTAPAAARRSALAAIETCLGRLHDAGCVLTRAKTAFALDGGVARIADPQAVRIVRRVGPAARRRDRRAVARFLGVA